MTMTEPKIYVLYENEEWMPPLRRALERAGLPYEEWFVHQGSVDLEEEPPVGVFFNRMSPSAHTRGHRQGLELTHAILAWLEGHGRRVINGSRAWALEVSKVRQYQALRRFGLQTPHTIAVVGGPEELKRAARKMPLPFITKHNCSGKGLGVYLFRSLEEFNRYVESSQFVPSPDGITLLQEYIEPQEGFITRVEIVNGEFLYAIKADTSRGFQLCPSDRCETGDAFCPTTDRAQPEGSFDRQSLFDLRGDLEARDPLVQRYIEFTQEIGLDIAGIEFIEDRHGNKITYDVNANTNYSPGVEERYGLDGWGRVVGFLARELEAVLNALRVA
jgi:glutathione synthase/RimK-type ligase-like ATP-grasp enzyme